MKDTKTSFKVKIPCPVKDERYQDACLSKIEDLTPEQEDNLKKWLSNPKHFLFCHAPFGIGKTYLASAIAMYFFEKNIPVYMFNEVELFKILDSEAHDGQLPSWKLSSICENPIVIWDDFGSTIQKGKNDYKENEKINLMFQFIDERYNSMLPTIVTSNFKIEELSEMINGRIASRLKATENLILEIYGENKRSLGL